MTSDTSRPAPWYDCSGKQPGNYVHPRDETRFITVDAGLQAIEFDCGSDENSPTGRMIYDESLDACVPYDKASHGSSS